LTRKKQIGTTDATNWRGAYADFPPRPISFCELLGEARMSDRTDWLRNLSTEELLFLRKVYDIINQSTCWTIESQRAAGEIRQELAPRGQIVGLENGSKGRFDE
jgi:hypothetical protein